jgi:hypothetical protein
MEAFVQSSIGNGQPGHERSKGKPAGPEAPTTDYASAGESKQRERGSYRTRQGRKKDMRYWGMEDGSADPFAGF